jgi:hypothetical protein
VLPVSSSAGNTGLPAQQPVLSCCTAVHSSTAVLAHLCDIVSELLLQQEGSTQTFVTSDSLISEWLIIIQLKLATGGWLRVGAVPGLLLSTNWCIDAWLLSAATWGSATAKNGHRQ